MSQESKPSSCEGRLERPSEDEALDCCLYSECLGSRLLLEDAGRCNVEKEDRIEPVLSDGVNWGVDEAMCSRNGFDWMVVALAGGVVSTISWGAALVSSMENL